MTAFRGSMASIATLFVASCSLVVDLDGLSGGEGSGKSPADGRAPSAPATTDGGNNDRDAGTKTKDAEGDAAPDTCEKFRITVDGSGGDPSYFPSNGSAVRKSVPEVIVIGSYGPEDGSTRIIDNRTTPHVLVLTSYESTKWVVVAKVPSAVTKVILTGYEPSTLEGSAVKNEPQGPSADEYPSHDADEVIAEALPKANATSVSGFGGIYQLGQATIEDACP